MKRIAKPQQAPSETKPAAPERTCEEQNIHEIEVQSGCERYSPVSYNSFELPSVSIRLSPLPGETPSQLFQRARLMADGWANIMFETKLKEHLGRVATTKKGI